MSDEKPVPKPAPAWNMGSLEKLLLGDLEAWRLAKEVIARVRGKKP